MGEWIVLSAAGILRYSGGTDCRHSCSIAGQQERRLYQSGRADRLCPRPAERPSHVRWVATKMVVDDPAKGLGGAPKEDQLWSKLTTLLGRPRRELGVVSGYFVPTKHGVNAFVRMARRGVRVKILTNSYEATDVPIVHSGYAKWRKPLLRAGVELYEMRGAPDGRGLERDVTAFGSTGSGARGAGSALHAKTFEVDGERVFVGSFNFDPRSANLNTELGFVVESSELARRMQDGFSRFIRQIPTRLNLTLTVSSFGVNEKVFDHHAHC